MTDRKREFVNLNLKILNYKSKSQILLVCKCSLAFGVG